MYSDSSRSLYQKIILWALAAMAVIFGVWTAVSRANEGVLFRDVLLEISEQGDATVYSGKLHGAAVTITCREENGTKLINFSADGRYYANCRVEFPEGTITTEYGKTVGRIRIIRNDEVLFSGGYDPDPGENSPMVYYSEDGAWSPLVSVIAESYGDPWSSFQFTAMDIMNFAKGHGLSAYGSWLGYFCTLLSSVFLALLTAFPNAIFYLRHFLHVREPEPTAFYYTCHKVGCIVTAVILLFSYWQSIETIV